MNKTRFLPVIFTATLLLATGCSEDYIPVPATQCGEIVEHSTKILGKFAKPKNQMLRQCQNSTDLQRGCALQAKIVADLTKCKDI
ncbi:MAG: hypothetical protein HKP55_07830 [Gammaproteobacteria bacterium]|nr:hypothetical protein [Gammaproteobacteria bacterium]NNJ91568.1 hypothetical protein [Gammaproteobacteria bacterium]